jgi:hypothetical protein
MQQMRKLSRNAFGSWLISGRFSTIYKLYITLNYPELFHGRHAEEKHRRLPAASYQPLAVFNADNGLSSSKDSKTGAPD